jgi:hypothetical protein
VDFVDVDQDNGFGFGHADFHRDFGSLFLHGILSEHFRGSDETVAIHYFPIDHPHGDL